MQIKLDVGDKIVVFDGKQIYQTYHEILYRAGDKFLVYERGNRKLVALSGPGELIESYPDLAKHVDLFPEVSLEDYLAEDSWLWEPDVIGKYLCSHGWYKARFDVFVYETGGPINYAWTPEEVGSRYYESNVEGLLDFLEKVEKRSREEITADLDKEECHGI